MKSLILLIHKYLSLLCIGLGVIHVIITIFSLLFKVNDAFLKTPMGLVIQGFIYAYAISFILTNLSRDDQR